MLVKCLSIYDSSNVMSLWCIINKQVELSSNSSSDPKVGYLMTVFKVTGKNTHRYVDSFAYIRSCLAFA